MARWRELGRRITALGEIGEILGAMRSLAFIEVRRLADGANRRQDAVRAIEAAIFDLAGHFPLVLPEREPTRDVVIALGSERGLCGDFNNSVAAALADTIAPRNATLFIVGSRLAQLMQEQGTAHHPLSGATVIEDVPQVLAAIVDALEGQARIEADGTFGLLLVHDDDNHGTHAQRILPMPELPATPRWRGKPALQLAPRQLYRSLVDHYVFAALQQALLDSLLAENRKRFDQMSGALDRLHERVDALGRARRRARQEAITEEIEVILLGVTNSTTQGIGR